MKQLLSTAVRAAARPLSSRNLLRSLAATATATLAMSAQAGVTINVNQVGADVVASGTGSLDLSGWVLFDLGNPPTPPAQLQNYVDNAGAAVYLGSAAESNGATWVFFGDVSGPVTLGPGNVQFFADSGTGTGFGFSVSGGNSAVVTIDLATPGALGGAFPFSSTSLGGIQATATWQNTTTASLGLVQGTSTWTWSTGTSTDFVTVNVLPTAPVPEPGSYALMLAGLAGLGFVARRRRAG